MTDEQTNIKEELDKRFNELPAVVQHAINSSAVEQHLRKLAETHKLHLDQWQALENEVKLALLGFSPGEKLAESIQANVGVPEQQAQELAENISRVVFEPIREELERELEHPEAKPEEKSGVETARSQVLEHAAPPTESPTPVPTPSVPNAPTQITPGTPPAPLSETKVERGPASGAYKSGEASAVRKNVEDDPYREPPA